MAEGRRPAGPVGTGRDRPRPRRSDGGVRPPRASDVVMISDGELRCLHASQAVMPLLGHWPDAMHDVVLTELVHPADQDLIRGVAGDTGASAVVRMHHRDGRWVELLATRMPESGLVGFAASEVADRVRVDEWLATERLVSDQVLANASDAIVGTDQDGMVVAWNRGAEVTFGWSREEVVGLDSTDLIVPPDRRAEYRAQMHDVLGTASARVDEPVETVFVRRDGREFDAEVTGWSVQVGQTWRFSALIRDVTARKEVQRALTEARERADEASRLKSDLMATVSHEIRTPMNGVIGLADVLLGTALDPTQRRYVEGIRTAGGTLLSVINDILDFAKAEAGRIVLDQEPFDLRDVVEEVAEVMAGAARAKGLELVDYVRADVPVALVGDPGRLRQVLLNLVGNAVKFTERGEVTITARLASSLVDGSARPMIRFDVIDTGIGIPPRDQERMFQAFSQADTSTTRQHGGTGLGLAISRRIVHAMGGRIGVESTPGRGSTFWFDLPVTPQTAPPPRPGHTLDLIGRRVLVVDDNATSRAVLDSQLREWRLAPTPVASGEEALAVLRDQVPGERPFELAIVDLAMPGMDGLELARRMKADPGIPPVRLILLSTGPDLDTQAARAAGAQAWLTKPVRRSQLFDSLAQVLTREEPRPAATDQPTAARRKGHLLLAEDNEINRLVALGILHGIGYDADIAVNGAQALEMLAEREYDGVLMDCQMPVMDGYTATGELRRREGNQRHTPVIALTASARWEDRDRCLAVGMDDFVAKPVDHESLAAALGRWIPDPAPGGVDSTTDIPADDVAASIHSRIDQLRGPDDRGAPLVEQLLDAYLDHTPADLDELADALGHADFTTATAKAHRLRGSAANMGAQRLADRLAEIEESARAARGEPAELAPVRAEYEMASSAMRRELRRITSGGR